MCYVNSQMQYISLGSRGISDDKEVKGKLFGSRLQCSAGRVIRMCCIVKGDILYIIIILELRDEFFT